MKKGEVMFKILPVLYKARLDAETAKAKVAQLKYKYTQQLVEQKVVSPNEAAIVGGRNGQRPRQRRTWRRLN